MMGVSKSQQGKLEKNLRVKMKIEFTRICWMQLKLFNPTEHNMET